MPDTTLGRIPEPVRDRLDLEIAADGALLDSAARHLAAGIELLAVVDPAEAIDLRAAVEDAVGNARTRLRARADDRGTDPAIVDMVEYARMAAMMPQQAAE